MTLTKSESRKVELGRASELDQLVEFVSFDGAATRKICVWSVPEAFNTKLAAVLLSEFAVLLSGADRTREAIFC